MFAAAVFLALLQAVALVDGAYTHGARNIQARHAAILHARAPVPAPDLVHPVKIRKRDSKKCRARPTSSSSVASAPTTPAAPVNAAPAPPPSETHKQAAPTVEQPKPEPKPTPTNKPSSGGGDSGGSDPFGGFFAGTQTGQMTYYELGLVACGQTYSDSDMVAAVSEQLFDKVPGAGANPNNNPICNKKVQVSFGGKSIVVSLVDRCTACAPTDLDLSPAAFSQLASQSLGRVSGMKWHFV